MTYTSDDFIANHPEKARELIDKLWTVYVFSEMVINTEQWSTTLFPQEEPSFWRQVWWHVGRVWDKKMKEYEANQRRLQIVASDELAASVVSNLQKSVQQVSEYLDNVKVDDKPA